MSATRYESMPAWLQHHIMAQITGKMESVLRNRLTPPRDFGARQGPERNDWDRIIEAVEWLSAESRPSPPGPPEGT